MMRHTIPFLFSGLMLLSASCEGRKVLTSYVVDTRTEKGIADAEVIRHDRRNKVISVSRTDNDGMIRFDSGFTGMLFGGPKFRYRIEKQGYYPVTGSEKFPPPVIHMFTVIDSNFNLQGKSWNLVSDSLILPEDIRQQTTFSEKKAVDVPGISQWRFEEDSTLNFYFLDTYEGVFLNKKIPWKLDQNILTIGEHTFIIVDLNSNELTIRRIIKDRRP